MIEDILFAIFGAPEKRRKENIELMLHNDRCMDIIRGVGSGDRDQLIYSNELYNRLLKIINEPGEKKKSLVSIAIKEQKRIEILRENRKERIYGMQYEELIFSIFTNKVDLPKDVLLEEISQKLGLEFDAAKELLSKWNSNMLVKESYTKNGYWEVGLNLEKNLYFNEGEVITRSEWLRKNRFSQDLEEFDIPK